MENPTHSFRETKLVLQFIWESQIKIKTGDELELAKKLKENIFFLPFILFVMQSSHFLYSQDLES